MAADLEADLEGVRRIASGGRVIGMTARSADVEAGRIAGPMVACDCF